MIDRQWLSAELRWGEWNGNEFQCVDASAANEMLAEIERLRAENADLRHDLERSMANHVADMNADQQGAAHE